MLPADWLISTSHDTFVLQFLCMVKDGMEFVYTKSCAHFLNILFNTESLTTHPESGPIHVMTSENNLPKQLQVAMSSTIWPRLPRSETLECVGTMYSLHYQKFVLHART